MIPKEYLNWQAFAAFMAVYILSVVILVSIPILAQRISEWSPAPVEVDFAEERKRRLKELKLGKKRRRA
uniref:Signal peptidase I n=1 Tax=Caenorhabditis tropicalis TaxID=1561998 RepID=A0A1I7TBR2_9PELO